MGIRPGWTFSFQRLSQVSPAGPARTIILVTIPTVEEDHVAWFKRPIFLLPFRDMALHDETAIPFCSFVQQLSDIDDAGFSDKLPGRNSIHKGKTRHNGIRL